MNCYSFWLKEENQKENIWILLLSGIGEEFLGSVPTGVKYLVSAV